MGDNPENTIVTLDKAVGRHSVECRPNSAIIKVMLICVMFKTLTYPLLSHNINFVFLVYIVIYICDIYM